MKFAVMIEDGFGRGRIVSRHHELDKAITKCHFLAKLGIEKSTILHIDRREYTLVNKVQKTITM